MRIDPYALMEVTTKFIIKSGEERSYRLNGKVAINENREARIYASVIDITYHIEADKI